MDEHKKLLEDIKTRVLVDPLFHARMQRTLSLVYKFSKEEHLDNRNDLVLQYAVAVGLLMAEKDPNAQA